MVIQSNKLAKTVIYIAGVQATLSRDVTDYKIPLLLSKESIKKANSMLDFPSDKLIIST